MNKNRDAYNAYMRKYMLKRYKERKAAATKFLGGKCVVEGCPVTHRLDFDHKDPKTKSFTIGELWSLAEETFWEEVKKCQLLCKKHHNEKTLRELGRKPARGTHGTLSSVVYCRPRCDLCKAAARKYAQERRERIKTKLP